MKVRELLHISIGDPAKFIVTIVDYELDDYKDDCLSDVVCSFRSALIPEAFLRDELLDTEVVRCGIKSENEFVIEIPCRGYIKEDNNEYPSKEEIHS